MIPCLAVDFNSQRSFDGQGSLVLINKTLGWVRPAGSAAGRGSISTIGHNMKWLLNGVLIRPEVDLVEVQVLCKSEVLCGAEEGVPISGGVFALLGIFCLVDPSTAMLLLL